MAGTTSRTLRHYDRIGLVRPSRVGSNGYRYYDRQALVRLQRVLLLRELGLGLKEIAGIMSARTDEAEALRAHLGLLRQEQARLGRQLRAVEYTLNALQGGEELMAENMFEGFDHTRHREEVERRWGKDAYARSDSWWKTLSDADREGWMLELKELNDGWSSAAAREDADPASPEAQELARRHVSWLRRVPGTPDGDFGVYVLGLADLYVADERFAANYGGAAGAAFVREALRIQVGEQA